MRESIQSLLGAIERDHGGIAVVWCPDIGLREWLVGEVESVVPTAAEAFRTSSVEEAIAWPRRMALLIPSTGDEVTTVLDLDGSRDRLHDEDHPRTQPIVLFLLRHGDGERALAEQAISLSSWIGGSDVDPEALSEIDDAAERTRFTEEAGQPPEAWLASWRAEEIRPTAESFALAYRAMLLEER
ncbi:hypothetical protein [Chondromyces apiculatus]|uniref:Uncharacterized protein n=1 Tax=Chondromyces apiculatus DSM 436 TaxID=1192034 RepID=A0A017T6D2_9BACT|nr:hypothetical protein [Chondromyces apiculatus]EYF04833.1 Hypothetical protein CAP_3859 [Chondromyces apiculatus DSM 436]